MNEKYQLLYCDMLNDIARCEQMELSDNEWVTASFWVAHNYWVRVKKFIDPNDFKNEAEEIEFFRNVKPQFTAHIEYFVILSEALVCLPPGSPDAIGYWEVEAKRFKRYHDRNQEFVTYYESGERCRDHLYFVKRNAVNNHMPKSPTYDVDPEYCSSHDHLVRSWLANKMYYEYIKQRLKAIKVID